MKIKRIATGAAAIVFAAAAGLLSGGCSTPTETTASATCPLGSAASPAGKPVYVVLDDTASHSASVAAARRQAFGVVVASAYACHAEVVLATSGPNPSYDRVVFNALASGTGPNSYFAHVDAVSAEKKMIAAFGRVDSPSTGPTDVLGGLISLHADLATFAGDDISVLVMASGLEGVQPLDLASDPSQLDKPATTASALATAGELPQLSDWHVSFLADPAADDEQSEALDALWWHLIDRSGAAPDGYLTAVLDWPLPKEPEPQTQVQVVPKVVSECHGHVHKITLPDVLFDVDEATLRPGTAPVIAQVAALLERNYPTAQVKLDGFTDSTGSPEYNVRLSTERADSLLLALESDSVPANRLTAVGLGATQFVATNATAAGRQQNRRVEVVIFTSAGTSSRLGCS